MQVVKNYLYNASYQVFILLVPLITTPYLSRVLGPSGIGVNAYTNSIIQYFILFGSIGVNLYGNRQVAFVRNDKQELSNTFYEIYFMRVATILIAFLLFLVFLHFTVHYHVYYWMQSVSLIAALFDISWFFMGMEDFAVTVLRNLVVKIITLVAIFLFVKTQKDLGTYILILSLSLLVGNLTLFPSLQKYISVPKWHTLKIWKHLRPSVAMFIPQVATQVYLVVNKTMLGSMTSVKAAGYFDQSDKIIKMVLAIVTATGTVMLPHVANAYSKGNIEKVKQLLYKSFGFVTLLSLPMTFGLLAVAPKFVPLFFTTKFNAVIPLIIIESIVILLIAWSNAVGTQYLLPTKQTKAYTLSVVLGAFVNIFANIPLIIFWGAIGTALATVISELTVTSYQLFVIRKQIEYRKLFVDYKKYGLSVFVMFLTVFILDRLLPTTWIMLGLEVVVGMIMYALLLVLLKVELVNDVKNMIKK